MKKFDILLVPNGWCFPQADCTKHAIVDLLCLSDYCDSGLKINYRFGRTEKICIEESSVKYSLKNHKADT